MLTVRIPDDLEREAVFRLSTPALYAIETDHLDALADGLFSQVLTLRLSATAAEGIGSRLVRWRTPSRSRS